MFDHRSPLVASLSLLFVLVIPARQAVAGPGELSREQLFSIGPGRRQPQAKALVLALLADPPRARRLLAGARFHRACPGSRKGRGAVAGSACSAVVRSMLRPKPGEAALMFRVTMVGTKGERFEALFKPRQRGYDDWATEVAVCRLAAHLDVRVAPCHERWVPREVLQGALARLPEAHRRRLRWGRGGKAIFGFFRLWAPTFRQRLGRRVATRRLLLQLARGLRVRNRSAVLGSRLHRRFADLLVLDFLVYNNDRRRNLGTLRDGKALLLYPIDFGDGLTATPRRKVLCRELLRASALFNRRLLNRIRALDDRLLRRLFRVAGLGALVPAVQRKLLLAQRRALLAHVGWARKRFGPEVLF